MRPVNKALKKILGYFIKTALSLFIVVALFLASLFFREQKLPHFAVERLTERLSTDRLEIACDDVFFGFRHGFRVSGVRIYDKSDPDFRRKPIASIRNVHYDFIRRRLWACGLKYDRLPEGYYGGETSFSPPASVDFGIPDIKGVEAVIESSEILGLTPDRVRADIYASSADRRVLLDNIVIMLPGKDSDTVLRGYAELNLRTQKIKSSLDGTATQRQIRPFLQVLEIQCALPYMDAFTDIVVPVEAHADFDVDIYSGDIGILLDLAVPKMGKYNSVPMAYAKGGIKFHSKADEDGRRVSVKVVLPSAEDNDGRRLSGWIAIDDFSDKFKIRYDVKTGLRFDDALKIADFMDPAMLDFIKFEDAPAITVKGVSGTSVEHLSLNDIQGEISAAGGVLDGFKFSSVNGVYSFKEDIFAINAELTGIRGGKAKFESTVFCEKFNENSAHFALKGTYRDGSLEELAEALSFDLGQRQGEIDIDLDITGDIVSNLWETVDGNGSVRISNGRLARMKLFSGLTELMAERVPGVSFLVDQTQASADFTFTNGVFRTENLYIEGGLVSVKGWGSYDIARDNLDFVARVQFMKKESIAGKILHPLTYPITKLLLEFRVLGPLDNPNWEYIQITDRIF